MDHHTYKTPPLPEPILSRPHLPQAILDLLSRLDTRICEGVVTLDKPALLHPLSSSAVRGILGHALKDARATTACQLFKPGNGTPPAFLIQPYESVSRLSHQFRFHFISWGEGRELMDTTVNLEQPYFEGRPFGRGREKAVSIEFTEPDILVFEGTNYHSLENCANPLRLHFVTPLNLKVYDRSNPDKPRKRNLAPDALSANHLVNGILRRLGNLCQIDGLTQLPEIKEMPLPVPTDRNLRFGGTDRSSSTQTNKVRLQGILGYMDLPSELDPMFVELIALASVFHMGHHPVEGCGLIRMEPLPGNYFF